MDNTRDNVINYFQNFRCEVLTSNPNNKNDLSEFISKKVNNSLELYLKDERFAWSEDSDGETRVYLIRDDKDKIAAYFSIKCGMLIKIPEEDNFSDDEQSFIESFIEFREKKDQVSFDKTYEAAVTLYGDKRAEQLYLLSDKKMKKQAEEQELGQSEYTLNVPACISAIELRHLCRNENYKFPDNLGVPLGFGVFWEIIVPKILEITDLIGCKYVYLFAADKTPTNEDMHIRKLVDYYKTNFKFSECDDNMKFIKPDYDLSCYGLMQEVSALQYNKEHIWEEFSDV